MRTGAKPWNRAHLLMPAAVPAGNDTIDRAYQTPELSQKAPGPQLTFEPNYQRKLGNVGIVAASFRCYTHAELQCHGTPAQPDLVLTVFFPFTSARSYSMYLYFLRSRATELMEEVIVADKGDHWFP